MNYREQLKQIQIEITCLELVKEIKDIVDDFYIHNGNGVSRIDDRLNHRAGEISVLYREIHLLHDKLSKIDKNLGKGVI